MYLLDNTVISELRRPDEADRNIASWPASVPAAQFYLFVIAILEIGHGTLQRARRDPVQGAQLRA